MSATYNEDEVLSAVYDPVTGTLKTKAGSTPVYSSDAFEVNYEGASNNTAQSLKSGTASKSHYIKTISISTTVAQWIRLEDTAGTPNTIVPKKYLPANSVWSMNYGDVPKKVAAGNGINVKTELGTGSISVEMTGYTI